MAKSRNNLLMAVGIVLYLVFFCSFTFHTVIYVLGGMAYIDFKFSPHEGVYVSSSRDASELTRAGRFSSLWREIKDCEWTQKWKDHRKHFLELPAPSDYEEILYGYAVVSPEESKLLRAQYDWEKIPPPEADEPYYEVIDGGLKKHARHWYYAFLIADLIPKFNGPDSDSVLYSRALEQEMVLGEYRYGSGEIFFDADRDMFFFYLIRRN